MIPLANTPSTLHFPSLPTLPVPCHSFAPFRPYLSLTSPTPIFPASHSFSPLPLSSPTFLILPVASLTNPGSAAHQYILSPLTPLCLPLTYRLLTLLSSLASSVRFHYLAVPLTPFFFSLPFPLCLLSYLAPFPLPAWPPLLTTTLSP